MELEGHFRMPSQDMPEPLVGEADLVSLLIGESSQDGLHQLILYRRVYHIRNSTASLRPALPPRSVPSDATVALALIAEAVRVPGSSQPCLIEVDGLGKGHTSRMQVGLLSERQLAP